MSQFLIRRIFWAFFLFVVATIITYVIFFLVPADPAVLAAGKATSPGIVAHIKKELHLDLPIYQQYWLFIWNLVRHGSFGQSFVNGLPVRRELSQEIPVTASIVLTISATRAAFNSPTLKAKFVTTFCLLQTSTVTSASRLRR